MSTDRDLAIERRLSTLEQKIDELGSNHIHHLTKKVDAIVWLLITTLTAIVVHAAGSWLNSK